MHSRLGTSGCLSPFGKGGARLFVLSQKNHATDQQRRFGISTEHVRSFVCVSKEPNQLFKVSESIEAITLKLSIAVVESFAQI